jgi:predicted metal-dependent TIM-barrel fold hydrolase
MQMIDAHVHIDSLNWSHFEAMALAGVTAVVAQVGGPNRGGVTVTSQTIFDLYERWIKYDSLRTRGFLIDTYVAVGISMVCVPTDYEKVIDALPRYLQEEKVVAIGEIGLEPNSETCPDLGKQEEILKAQLKVAKDHGVPVAFHTPFTEKPKWVERYFGLIEEAKLEPDKVVIDHADSSSLKMITEAGFTAGLTVQPWRKVTPPDAAKMVETADLDRVILDSDSAISLASDPLGVPKTALEMRKLGFREEDIRKVVYDNAKRFFNLG